MRWKFRKILVKLFRLNNTPHEIAIGVAIGVFIAVMPLYGLHTLMVIIAALLVRRSNKIAMLLGTNISLPPTVPFITWAGYEIGRFILRRDFPDLDWTVFKSITVKKVINLYPPLFIGSLILGIVLAVVFYFLIYFIVQGIIKRKQLKAFDRHAKKKTSHA